jgi:hypothetical protein
LLKLLLVFAKIVIITLVFEKNANFFAENWQKSQKIVIKTSTPGRTASTFYSTFFVTAFRAAIRRSRLPRENAKSAETFFSQTSLPPHPPPKVFLCVSCGKSFECGESSAIFCGAVPFRGKKRKK